MFELFLMFQFEASPLVVSVEEERWTVGLKLSTVHGVTILVISTPIEKPSFPHQNH